jgi:glycosyltransferase involved in cell wall biosynthesis
MISVAIFAHNEERRIAASLNSLPLERDDVRFHLLVNGSRDATANIARSIAAQHSSLIVHDIAQGGKSRTWNHYVHQIISGDESHYIFMDGDAELTPGAIDALCAVLDASPTANAASGMPMNGKRHRYYQKAMADERGLFGDLYALSTDFVRRIRAAGLYLPADLIGDDGLIGAWSLCDLQHEGHWDRSRTIPCVDAGFYCEPFAFGSLSAWRMQYKRMINYSVRHFQNRIISNIMRDAGPKGGPSGLPTRMAHLYPNWITKFQPRSNPTLWWFDRLALKRMRAAIR